MDFKRAMITVGFVVFVSAPAFAQCVPGHPLTPEQQASHRLAIQAARPINTAEANQPGARSRQYLDQAALQAQLVSQKARMDANSFDQKLDFTPGAQVFEGWTLTIEVSQNGYWFSLKDTKDPCGFAVISNRDGIIYNSMPLQ